MRSPKPAPPRLFNRVAQFATPTSSPPPTSMDSRWCLRVGGTSDTDAVKGKGQRAEGKGQERADDCRLLITFAFFPLTFPFPSALCPLPLLLSRSSHQLLV